MPSGELLILFFSSRFQGDFAPQDITDFVVKNGFYVVILNW